MSVCGLTLNEILMVVLTAVIAGSAVWQARIVREQATLMEQQAALMAKAMEDEERRNRPAARVIPHSHDFGKIGPGDERETTRFAGFSMTNSGAVEIEVVGWSLQLGLKEGDSVLSKSPLLDPAESFNGQRLSDVDFPHRLKYGETVRVVFEEEELLARLRHEGDGVIARVRPEFRDSLGNTYSMDYWIEWAEGATAAHDGPGPGYLTPEEKERLTRRGG